MSKTIFFELLNPMIELYFLSAIILGLIILWVLLDLLKKLVNKQVDEQVERFANEAKIPRALKDRIGVKIKWY